MNRNDDWKPSEQLRRIFEHRKMTAKYVNLIGEKVSYDNFKPERRYWYIFG
jgi:hypothetical protein